MALEVGEYISDLVPSNPLGTDPRRQGDDHVRLVKKTVQQSFPNINGPVNATPAELNLLVGQTTLFPEGVIVAWAGLIANIPEGFALCNGTGTTSTLAIPVPDLTGRFIMHADADTGGTYNVSTQGGSDDITLPASTDSHTLTINEMPSHTHGMQAFPNLSSNGGANSIVQNAGSANVNTKSTGGGAGHSHGISYNGTGKNVSKYYALAYIIKL